MGAMAPLAPMKTHPMDEPPMIGEAQLPGDVMIGLSRQLSLGNLRHRSMLVCLQ